MVPQHRIRIYDDFDSLSIIRFLEPLTGDVFKARFEDCHFDENIFPSLGKEKLVFEARQKSIWNNSKLSHFDPRTNQCEFEVQKIIHLQNITNQLQDVFNNSEKMIKSHILAANAPSRIEISKGKRGNIVANESIPCLKRERPFGAKEKNPRK